eukprot:GHVQ01016913.1.p1 GENE.GHVQ01016913.1~~GHVQ01016913.1.p1  ORF type:complete len:473 (-),score=59.00 GHVQ01016913.1:230-1459(-)
MLDAEGVGNDGSGSGGWMGSGTSNQQPPATPEDPTISPERSPEDEMTTPPEGQKSPSAGPPEAPPEGQKSPSAGPPEATPEDPTISPERSPEDEMTTPPEGQKSPSAGPPEAPPEGQKSPSAGPPEGTTNVPKSSSEAWDSEPCGDCRLPKHSTCTRDEFTNTGFCACDSASFLNDDAQCQGKEGYEAEFNGPKTIFKQCDKSECNTVKLSEEQANLLTTRCQDCCGGDHISSCLIKPGGKHATCFVSGKTGSREKWACPDGNAWPNGAMMEGFGSSGNPTEVAQYTNTLHGSMSPPNVSAQRAHTGLMLGLGIPVIVCLFAIGAAFFIYTCWRSYHGRASARADQEAVYLASYQPTHTQTNKHKKHTNKPKRKHTNKDQATHTPQTVFNLAVERELKNTQPIKANPGK